MEPTQLQRIGVHQIIESPPFMILIQSLQGCVGSTMEEVRHTASPLQYNNKSARPDRMREVEARVSKE